MKITAKHYARALYETLQDIPATDRSTTVQKFLTVLYQRGELKQLPEILQHISDMEEATAGIVRVMVTTAREMPNEDIRDLVSKFVDTPNAQIDVSIDETLIGGVTVETKDKRWDLSASGQLRALQHKLRS